MTAEGGINVQAEATSESKEMSEIAYASFQLASTPYILGIASECIQDNMSQACCLVKPCRISLPLALAFPRPKFCLVSSPFRCCWSSHLRRRGTRCGDMEACATISECRLFSSFYIDFIHIAIYSSLLSIVPILFCKEVRLRLPGEGEYGISLNANVFCAWPQSAFKPTLLSHAVLCVGQPAFWHSREQ
eukprot:scaffold39938_cov250-Skeletonema_dohrnii-CCMP3373.AAC.1